MKNPAIAAFELLDKIFNGGANKKCREVEEIVREGCRRRVSGQSFEDVNQFFRAKAASCQIKASIAAFWAMAGTHFFDHSCYKLAVEYLELCLTPAHRGGIPDEAVKRIEKMLIEAKSVAANYR